MSAFEPCVKSISFGSVSISENCDKVGAEGLSSEFNSNSSLVTLSEKQKSASFRLESILFGKEDLRVSLKADDGARLTFHYDNSRDLGPLMIFLFVLNRF